MTIDFANLQYQYQHYKDEIDSAIHAVLDKSNYIMGEEVALLEEALEHFTGSDHAITCSSGTDALLLAMMALGIKPGDEIITTPFTFIATAETIAFLGATPVFVDIDEQSYNIDVTQIEMAITPKTKAIIPVSLYGQPSDMDAIKTLADQYRLKVIIDGAQSFGSTYKGISDSNLGDVSITSFFPAKPLGCFGDGGALFCSDAELAKKIKSLRIHGQSKRYHHDYIGMGGRMDTLQAAILHVKLKHYKEDLHLREQVAKKYNNILSTASAILPTLTKDTTSAWAQYSIRVKNREHVQKYLKSKGIPTAIHYPMPLHLQVAFKYLRYEEGDFPVAEQVSKEIMSLPMNPYLKEDEIDYITSHLTEALHH